jgi:hypothetical protein
MHRGLTLASGVFPRIGEALATFSGKPFVFLLLSLAGACLVQSSLLAVFTRNPEGYLLGVPKWYSALWVLPVLAIAYAVILASHVILCGLEWLLRVSLGRIGLLRPSRSVVNRVRYVKLTLTRDVWSARVKNSISSRHNMQFPLSYSSYWSNWLYLINSPSLSALSSIS